MRRFCHTYGLMLAVNTAGGVAPAVAMQLFRQETNWYIFGMDLLYGLIYAHCIGTLAFTVMGRVGPRVWRWPKVYAVLGMLLSLVGIALVGSLLANGIFVALGIHR